MNFDEITTAKIFDQPASFAANILSTKFILFALIVTSMTFSWQCTQTVSGDQLAWTIFSMFAPSRSVFVVSGICNHSAKLIIQNAILQLNIYYLFNVNRLPSVAVSFVRSLIHQRTSSSHHLSAATRKVKIKTPFINRWKE